jgi:hypothetical protein
MEIAAYSRRLVFDRISAYPIFESLLILKILNLIIPTDRIHWREILSFSKTP